MHVTGMHAVLRVNSYHCACGSHVKYMLYGLCVCSAIYWTEWGSRPRISRAAMDGSERTTVVHHNILWPNCLTIDYAADRLYWIDARYYMLETIRLDGSQRQTLLDHGN